MTNIQKGALAGVFGLLLSSGTVLSAGQDRPTPGLYEITTRTTYRDLPVEDSTITTRSCLTREDLDRDPASAFADLPEGRSCDMESFQMAGGSIDMRVVCQMETGSMTMVVGGSFDEQGYRMISDVTVVVNGEEVEMQTTVDGKRLGDC